MKAPEPTILSGIQPTGTPTLGNLIGAYLPFRKLIGEGTHRTYIMVVDHHAITVRQDPKAFHQNILAGTAWYLANGVTPDKCTLFIQSHVRAHAELAWILNTFTQMGELERMTQFKDKAAQHKDNINAGLFTYPVLQAADILLYDATDVPVGDDQVQHVELTRDIATRVNNLYGPTFVMPRVMAPKVGARVRDLQEPERKMSKSRPGPGTILLDEPVDGAAKKIRRAVTDSTGVIAYEPEARPGLANLIDILAALTGRAPKAVAEEFAGQQYGPLKNAVADALVATLEPLQAEHKRLMADQGHLLGLLREGAEKASAHAEATLRRVKEKVGYVLA
jgi:tryptophanyl-tRNA synthetase